MIFDKHKHTNQCKNILQKNKEALTALDIFHQEVTQDGESRKRIKEKTQECDEIQKSLEL